MTTPNGAAGAFLEELEAEAVATRKMLERVPEGRLGWRPHPRSQTLGQLASHVAAIPSLVERLLGKAEIDVAGRDFTPPQPDSVAAIRASFEESMASARRTLSSWTAADLGASWRMLAGGRELMRRPKGAMLRSIVGNHMIHHRGQLSVYLRLLDVPLPSVYGPSADENVFAAAASR